ncbi:MAG: hypothetical protein K2L17_08560 [Muribaculaceae bacterium]|nr:hypothetical protein [Muribaculaceae bacterium]
MKSVTALDSWLFLKCGSFIFIVKNEVTVMSSGYDYVPKAFVPIGMSALVYHISYGVGSSLLVLR